MALENRDAYMVLEDIVGTENISEEPATLDAYAYQWGAALFTNTPYLPRAGAVVLPKNTKEVQSIVRACNKYNVRYKAFSSGWGFYSALGLDDSAIQIDLRRMNRILEINEKSMYAVIEPYVTSAQLQTELMKVGFNMNYVRREDTFFPDSPEMQYLGELQIPIFEGTLRFAQVKEAKAEYRKSQWILEDLKREIHLQVMQALLDLQKFSASLKATEKQIILAEENLRRIKLQYKEGLASNLDVIDANTLLVKAKIGYTNLNYDQALAYFAMQLALGRLSADEVKKIFHDPKS